MNCLDFRRRLASDPGCRDEDFVEHRQACTECAAAVARATVFEQRLKEATRVAVPENLASGIMLRHSFQARQSTADWRRRVRVALAASVLLVVGAVAGGLIHSMRGPTLDQEVIALVNSAPYALSSDKTVSKEDIVAALRPVGLKVEGGLGEVTFASRCYVRGLLSGHLVLRGRSAPITVFLIPGELVERRKPFQSSHLSGVLLPARHGTIAIVAAPGEALGSVEADLRAAVRWQV